MSVDTRARAARLEAVAKLHEKHTVFLRLLFNKVLDAGQKLVPDKLSLEQVPRLALQNGMVTRDRHESVQPGTRSGVDRLMLEPQNSSSPANPGPEGPAAESGSPVVAEGRAEPVEHA